MTYIIAVLLGINAAILTLLLLRWKAPSVEPAKPTRPTDMAVLEKEKQRMVAEQEAFQQLMSYNAGVAYRTIDKGGR